MKLYLRRQTLTATKGMLSKRTEFSFSLYARLDLDQDERELVNGYDLGRVKLGSHEKPLPTNKEILYTKSYSVAHLIPGRDISCLSFLNMMGLEQSLVKGCHFFREVLEHASDIKQSHEALYAFDDKNAVSAAA